jgi:tetratricopeptide (TPR) repeat protein
MADRDRDALAFESTADVLGEPPVIDPIEMDRVRARAESRLFGSAPPARIGRYKVVDTLGSGGMGTVYSAFDPQLQRKVALKVHHPLRNNDGRTQQRMILEARTLAKLDHPNIVKVHDSMLENEQVIVVMELLDGDTLERWQEHETHDWREIVDVYAEAGEGLAAAHGVGVVHRDFKPSNVIIGKDGRVRVVDFGLARLFETHVDSDLGHTGASPGLTAAGDFVGTLAYASPEQLASRSVMAASDQFSFCVALHTAVEGVAPFDGLDKVARAASIERGDPLRARNRRVPAWLRALIRRGLSANHDERFASMEVVVHELRRARGWRRWRLPVIAAATVSVAVAATAALSANHLESCDGGAALAERAWNAGLRERVGGAIDGVGTSYAVEVRDRALRTLDRYAIDWRGAHRAVCLAHQHGETSALLLDRQMACLSRRLGDLRAAVGVLASVDTSALAQVMDVASEIPSAAPCLDVELVQRDVAPPATLEMRAQIDGLRAQISSAEALARAGRTEAALAKLSTVRTMADATPYTPIRVDVALTEGRILLAQGEDERAIVALAVARDGAFEQLMLSVAVEASARIIYAEGARSPRLDRLQGELATLLPLSAGLHGDTFVRPLLLNNVGTVYLAAGRRSDAASFFELAKAEIRRHGSGNLELANVDLNLSMITSDTPKREALARGVWESFRDTLGEQHLSTLDALNAYAMYVADPAVALEAVSRARASYERFHPTARREIAKAFARGAVLAAELGDLAQSNGLYRSAIAGMEGDSDADVVVRHALCVGELALQTGDPAGARNVLRSVVDGRLHSSNWWERADALRAEVGLGLAAAALGDDASALRNLEAAVADYPAVVGINEQFEPKRYLARARRALAQVLRRGDPARAKSLEDDAQSFYRAASVRAYQWILRNGER